MALTTSRSKSVPVFPFYVKAKKKKKKPTKEKPNKGALQSKPPQGTLRGFVGIIWIKTLFPT